MLMRFHLQQKRDNLQEVIKINNLGIMDYNIMDRIVKI